MGASKKILAFVLALSYLTIATTSYLFAQSAITHSTDTKVNKAKITLGFEAGKELSFNKPSQLLKKNKLNNAYSGTFIVRKTLNSHFKFETGLSYYSYQNILQTPVTADVNNKHPKTVQQNKFAVPVTIQYYFLPEQYKIRPFCGTGLLCGNNPNNDSQYAADANHVVNTQSDTKYISILFTQGVTFEINTKIEITQSFHFIPGNTNNTFGINLGIGYSIP